MPLAIQAYPPDCMGESPAADDADDECRDDELRCWVARLGLFASCSAALLHPVWWWQELWSLWPFLLTGPKAATPPMVWIHRKRNGAERRTRERNRD